MGACVRSMVKSVVGWWEDGPGTGACGTNVYCGGMPAMEERRDMVRGASGRGGTRQAAATRLECARGRGRRQTTRKQMMRRDALLASQCVTEQSTDEKYGITVIN